MIYDYCRKKINKIPEFYTIFTRKMPDYIIRQRERDRGQAKAKSWRPRPKRRGQNFGLDLNITDYLLSSGVGI